MPTVKIGKYKRPGIYMEEFDSSVIDTPTITGLQTIVIGSSKKGPINAPITLKSQADLRRVFGDLDRNLESKGSYFHRTISKVLENSPVVAINLINPDDNLDKLEYKSISAAASQDNAPVKESPYSNFFDTSTFWKRDREAFLYTANNPSSGNILHITNLNDKEITVFIVKASNKTGYDKTLLEWYGSVNDVPYYLDHRDYASDYMVDVVVLDGNWTNYSVLSVDPTWSRFFNNSGLIKSELFNLADHPSVNELYTWRGLSLIPYFRDIQGTNIFIETRINERTDRTGLYCAFDIDAVETDERTGFLDLIGNNLIGNGEDRETINFLSYEEKITEIIPYVEQELDIPGNTYQLTFSDYYQAIASERKGMNAEGYVHELEGLDTTPNVVTNSAATYSIGYDSGVDSYAIIGGEKVTVQGVTFSFAPDDITTPSTLPGATHSHTEVFFIDVDGTIKRNPSRSQLQTCIVLGKLDIMVKHDLNRDKIFDNIDYTAVSVDTLGFIYFDNNSDITATVTGDSITYEFLGTSGNADVKDYVNYRKFKTYNQMVGILNNTDVHKATILIGDNNDKKALKDLEIDIPVNQYSNKTITFSGFDSISTSKLDTDGFILHPVDNELILGEKGMITSDAYPTSNDIGVVAQWSKLYQDYNNGLINTGDKFYENLLEGMSPPPSLVTFMDDGSGNDYIIFDEEVTFDVASNIIVPGTTINKGKFEIADTTPIDLSVVATHSFVGMTYGFAYKVEEDVVYETVDNPKQIWDTRATQTHYMKFYKVDDVLNIDFTDSAMTIGAPTDNKSLHVVSQNSNFKQTVEVEMPTGYVRPSNVILVDGSRYSEIKIGDFLEALVDSTLGEVNPRKLTRILSKKIYVGDPNLVEIRCDSAIKLYNFDGDLQTFRFTQIEDYVNTYKGISLSGYKLRADLLPNGTDSRLAEITQVIGKGTPMFNSLVDKDVIDFRYLVDSYGLGLTENSKQVFADICGKRLDTFGILNMPSMNDFRKSSSPTFVDENGRLSTEYIALGGNPDSSPAFNYSLAEGDGKTCVGYFTPYVIVNDNGRPKNVPPAAWVATSFLRKHNSALTSVTPWTIVAGITDGQVTGVAGLEYAFNGTDIENLNGMSVNPIVSKRNRGRVIETENTAQTLKTSALSYIHVREVLIELERDLSDMLLQFQWKYNTPEIRAEIKLRADAICADYVNRNGLYNFFNKCDAENNTPEIIDHQMGVLDTYCEPIKGMGVIVNNVTILKTGSVSSGGFI